jgi:hypothetical protein
MSTFEPVVRCILPFKQFSHCRFFSEICRGGDVEEHDDRDGGKHLEVERIRLIRSLFV